MRPRVILHFWSPWYGFICPSMFLISSRKSGEPPTSSVGREGPHPVLPLQRSCHLLHHHPESCSDPATPTKHYSLAHKTISQAITLHLPKSVKSLHHSHTLCAYHHNIPGSSVLSHSILSKLLLLTEPQLQQSPTNYNKPPLKFPINLTTTLQKTSGFPQSLCTSTPGKIPQHGTKEAVSGRSRGDKQSESKAKMPSRLQANNLSWPLAAPTHY